jgi:hypothetical protein
MKFCTVCLSAIEIERIEILPETTFCSVCARVHSNVKPRLGRMAFGHKTGGEIMLMSEETFKETKKYFDPDSY